MTRNDPPPTHATHSDDARRARIRALVTAAPRLTDEQRTRLRPLVAGLRTAHSEQRDTA